MTDTLRMLRAGGGNRVAVILPTDNPLYRVVVSLSPRNLFLTGSAYPVHVNWLWPTSKEPKLHVIDYRHVEARPLG